MLALSTVWPLLPAYQSFQQFISEGVRPSQNGIELFHDCAICELHSGGELARKLAHPKPRRTTQFVETSSCVDTTTVSSARMSSTVADRGRHAARVSREPDASPSWSRRRHRQAPSGVMPCCLQRAGFPTARPWRSTRPAWPRTSAATSSPTNTANDPPRHLGTGRHHEPPAPQAHRERRGARRRPQHRPPGGPAEPSTYSQSPTRSSAPQAPPFLGNTCFCRVAFGSEIRSTRAPPRHVATERRLLTHTFSR